MTRAPGRICDHLLVNRAQHTHGKAIAAGICVAGAGMLAYGVRGRTSRLLAPSVWRGDPARGSIALTFDDGPSETTPQFIEALSEFNAPATFFQCGANVRRLPAIAQMVHAAGHEIGNHSDTHPLCCFRSPSFIDGEFSRAQDTFGHVLGVTPELARAPFGARWFGFSRMQKRLGLLGVMWTVIGLDWKLPALVIYERILRAARNGAIVCLHDGRGCSSKPDVRASLEALRSILPALAAQGYRFETVSQILCPAI